MRFVLYSEKTVTQCLTAINARMHVKETSTRPALDGWVEKGGAFSIIMTAPVVGKFRRRTALTAKVERQGGITVIQGSVPSGVSRDGQAVIFIALALVALAMMGSGNVLFGLLLVPFAAYLYIPLHGDYLNSSVLVDEVEKTLKAKARPPKKLAEGKSSTARAASGMRTAAKPPAKTAAPKRAPAKPAAAKSTAAKNTAAKKPAASKQEDDPFEEFPPMDELPSAPQFPGMSGESSP